MTTVCVARHAESTERRLCEAVAQRCGVEGDLGRRTPDGVLEDCGVQSEGWVWGWAVGSIRAVEADRDVWVDHAACLNSTTLE